MSILDLQELRRGERDELTSTGVYMDEASGGLKEEQATWRLADFTPNSDEYYQMLFDRITSLF